MGPKDPDGMANSVDPDQTARWDYTVCPVLSVRKFRNIMVLVVTIPKISRLQLDSVAEQDCLSLIWSQTPKEHFFSILRSNDNYRLVVK